MSDSSSPPISVATSTGARLASVTAVISVVAPLAAICMCVVFFESLRAILQSSGGTLQLTTLTVLAITPPALVLFGFIAGIVALALTKRFGSKGVFRKAIVGICVNGLLLALLIGALVVLVLQVKNTPATTQGVYDQALATLSKASTGEQKFYALGDAAKECFAVGKIKQAREYATELLKLAPRFRDNWNYGNAIQYGNLVLGRIAVREGRIQKAEGYLLAAGKSPGSPQMDSFGPNMSLAKDLLEKGRRKVVLKYFALCRKFWKMDFGKLDDWSRLVKAGKIPNFGANLLY